jgi:hypothetical protein
MALFNETLNNDVTVYWGYSKPHRVLGWPCLILKKILNAMPMRRFLFYYHRMVIHHNKYTSDCHKQKKTPLLPQIRTVSWE